MIRPAPAMLLHKSFRILALTLLVLSSFGAMKAQNRLGPGPGSQQRQGPPKSTGPGIRPVGPEPVRGGRVVNIETYAQANCAGKRLCQRAFFAAIADARAALKQDPALRYTIEIPAGTYDVSDEIALLPGTKAVFDVSYIHPTTGNLTIRGAGSSQTTLITANENEQFFGRDVSNIAIEGMTLRRHAMTTTQGTVVKAGPGEITIRIPPGFPLVTEVFSPTSGNGSWVRAYDNSNPLDPHIDTDPKNDQIHFGHNHPPTCAGRLCTISFDPITTPVPAFYTKPHETIGVKSSKGGGAYTFDNRDGTINGANVGFRDIVWYDNGRGVFFNIKQLFVLNCSIRRRPPVEGQGQAMSTSSGGPQLTYNKDHPAMDAGNRVDHFVAESTGDDSLAIFNDMSTNTVFSNTLISNSFARTINLFRSCHVRLENNVGKFCSPQTDFPKQYQGCITDTSHPGPTPCGPNL